MISVRSRTRRARADACPCSRSARRAWRASWALERGSTQGCYRGRTCRARPTRSRSGPHRRCRRWRRRRRGAGRWPFARWRPGRQRSRKLGRAPAPGPERAHEVTDRARRVDHGRRVEGGRRELNARSRRRPRDAAAGPRPRVGHRPVCSRDECSPRRRRARPRGLLWSQRDRYVRPHQPQI